MAETIVNPRFVDIKRMNLLREKIIQFDTNYKTLAKAIRLMALFVFSARFLLIFSLWTSPFYKNWYGCDASFFTMAGRGIARAGWVPYRDFFDLKGPYFFFIEALSQTVVTGRTGAFILQIFALFFAILFMIKTCRLFVSTKKTTFIVALILTFYASTLWGGNTLEEFMLPLLFLSMYLILRDLSKDESIRSSSALITGICFGIMVFAKITVAAPIAGIVLAVIICWIKDRRFPELLIFLLYSFLGILIAATPIFIYFYYHGMLSEMLYAVFIFAFKRGTDFGTKFNIRWELKISGCYFAIIFALCQLKNKRIKSALDNFMLTAIICTGILTAFVFHFGDPFIYYFTTAYPILMLTFVCMFILYDPFVLFRSWRLDVPVIAFFIVLVYFGGHVANQLNTVLFDRGNSYYQEYVDYANEMASLIPDCDKDDVYSLNMDMQWFECNQILPCYSYTINLQFFVALDQRIEDNIINKLKNDPPKWIVCGGDISSYLPNIADVIFSEYTNVYENPYGALYLLD